MRQLVSWIINFPIPQDFSMFLIEPRHYLPDILKDTREFGACAPLSDGLRL